MNFDFFVSILEQIKEYSPPMGISLHLGGEPLLHPMVSEFIEATNKILKICPMMATNGTLLNDNTVAKLIHAGGARLIIDFSANKENFEKLRYGAIWEEVLVNIRSALEAGLKITIRNLDEGDGMDIRKIFGSHRNLVITPFDLHNVGGDFASTVETEFKLNIERKKYHHCTHPWFGMAIAWNGDVVVCCRDVLHSHKVGSLKDKTLAEIWFGEGFGQIRKLLVQQKLGDLPMCRTCSRPWEYKNCPYALLVNYCFKWQDWS